MKSFIMKGLCAIALCAFAVPAFAYDWVQIGAGHYIDASSIRPASNYGTYTMLTKYVASGNPLEVINGRDVWTIRTNSFVDCTTNFAKTVSYTAYDKNGRVVTTGRNVGKHWYDINNPGSRAYESYSFVCTDRYLRQHPNYADLWYY